MLHDPQLPLQKAVYQVLTSDPITVNRLEVKAYEFAPTDAQAPYILLTQQTVSPISVAYGCKRWECTLLLDIVTSFPDKNQVSSLLSAQIAEQVLSRLEGQRLVLEGGFQMSPAELIMSSMLVDNPTKDTVDVHRYLRFAFKVEQHK